MEGLTFKWEYRDKGTRAVIKAIKYNFAKELVDVIFDKAVFDGEFDVDMIVPLPLHRLRQNWRGFNQANLVAGRLGEKMKIPIREVLLRKKATKQLASMSSSKERKSEISGAFGVYEVLREELRGKRLLLVDDVFTSGATMREATLVLKRAGAMEVWGWVLAA